MKDVLVEFNDYGAVIHKDPDVIEEKKDLPNCFLNPDLSRVYGVSPAYWTLNEYNKILKCSEEEMQKRNVYHKTVVSSSEPKVEKVHIEDLREEFEEKFDAKEERLIEEITRLKQEIAQSQDDTKEALSKLIFELNKNREMLSVTKMHLADELHKNHKNHIKLAAGVLLAAILAVALKILIAIN